MGRIIVPYALVSGAVGFSSLDLPHSLGGATEHLEQYVGLGWLELVVAQSVVRQHVERPHSTPFRTLFLDSRPTKSGLLAKVITVDQPVKFLSLNTARPRLQLSMRPKLLLAEGVCAACAHALIQAWQARQPVRTQALFYILALIKMGAEWTEVGLHVLYDCPKVRM